MVDSLTYVTISYSKILLLFTIEVFYLFIGKPCLPIYRPVNGNKTCSGYTTEHTCVFSCSVGYKQVGSHNRTCTASKRWTGKEAKCQRKCKNINPLQVNHAKRSSFHFLTHLEFSSLALQI